MAAPTFVAKGTVGWGLGNVTPGMPSGIAADDILLLFVQSSNETITAPSGWTEIANSPQGQGTGGTAGANRGAIFWLRYTGSESAPTVSDTGDHTYSVILAFRGCVNSGDPWDVTAGNSVSSQTACTAPALTTTIDDALIVAAISCSRDVNSSANFSSWTDLGGALDAALTEQHDNTAAGGTGGGWGIGTSTKTTAGSISSATAATLAAAATQNNYLIALKPPTSGVVEADGSSSGAGSSSVAGAAIWDSVSSAAGVGASLVVGAVLWLSAGSSAGVSDAGSVATALWAVTSESSGAATAAADGEDAATGGADANASGSSAAVAAATAIWDSVGNASGIGAAAGAAATIFDSLGNSAGAGTVNGISSAIVGATASSTGSAAVLGVSDNAPEMTINAGQVAGSILRAAGSGGTLKVASSQSSLGITNTA